MRVYRAVIVLLGALKTELQAWYRAFLEAIPGETGCFFRRHLYGFLGADGSRVLSHVTIYHPENLRLGENAGISSFSQLNAAGGIVIGDNVLIGPGSKIWSQNHRFSSLDLPIAHQGYERSQVTIGRDAWLAAGVIVLPGVTIGEGTVVAAGAVVNRSTAPYSIVAGVPARQVGTRLAGSRESAEILHSFR